MTEQSPRETRIPLFTRADAVEPSAIGTMYTWNISDGGMYLKAPHAAANDLPVGSDLAFDFALPDGSPRVKVNAKVVWIDPTVRDHQGESVVGIGARFADIDDESATRIRRFVQTFRYRVVCHGVADRQALIDAVGDVFDIQEVDTEPALEEAVESGNTGVIVLGDSGYLQRFLSDRNLASEPPILYTGSQIGQALEAVLLKNENVTYLEPPVGRWVLRSIVQRAVESRLLAFQNQLLNDELSRALERLRRENYHLRQATPEAIDGMVGGSAAIRSTFDMIERVAPFSTSVMIQGETGTGKELIARAVHKKSSRAEQPFIAQNCAAVTETLLDSELFGHARGAFTGATHDRAGIFEAANGGTVFLDEVGEMTPAMQAKVLRVLHDGEIRRVGEVQTRKVDVRVIAATHRNLEQMAKEGKFREDLYYRLRAFTIVVPPLKQRTEDIPLLALHFLEKLSERHGKKAITFTADAMKVLEDHNWPGNVRELENTIEQLLVLASDNGKIDGALVRQTLGTDSSAAEAPERGARSLSDALDDYERTLLRRELDKAGGVITRAALSLGLDRSTLSKRCKRLGLTSRSAPGRELVQGSGTASASPGSTPKTP